MTTGIGFASAGAVIGLSILGTTGCTPAPAAPAVAPDQHEVYLTARVARVWMTTLGVLTEVGLPVDTADRAGGFVHTRDTTLSINDASAIDCGQSDHPRNSQIDVYAQLTIRMRPIRDTTALELRAAFRGRDPRKQGQSPGSSIACTSSGWFENNLITMVQARSGASIATVQARGLAPVPTPDGVRSDSLYPWVGSTVTRQYFQAGCDAAKRIAPTDRVFLSSSETAIAMGFSRSKAPGC